MNPTQITPWGRAELFLTCLMRFAKPTVGKKNETAIHMSYRAIARTWRRQVLHDSDKIAIKGSGIKIRDGLGVELSPCLSKLTIWSNLLNRLARRSNVSMKHISRQLTIGILLIIGGEKGCRYKTIAPRRLHSKQPKNTQLPQKPNKNVSHTGTLVRDKSTWRAKLTPMGNFHIHVRIYPKS